jgi:RHS repeat-associated protein
VLDNTGSWVNREEYFPYGETSLGSYGRKRYRSTGKERDEETGLQYFGARYHAPWLGRWISCDPLAVNSGTDSSTYSYLHGRVLSAVDPTGLDDEFVTQNSEYGPGESAPGGAPLPSVASTPQPGDPNFMGPVQDIESTPAVPAASAQLAKSTNSKGAPDRAYQGPAIAQTSPSSDWEYIWSQLKQAPGRWLNSGDLWWDLGITKPVAPGPGDAITTGPLSKKDEARFFTAMNLASIALPVALEADLGQLARMSLNERAFQIHGDLPLNNPFESSSWEQNQLTVGIVAPKGIDKLIVTVTTDWAYDQGCSTLYTTVLIC